MNIMSPSRNATQGDNNDTAATIKPRNDFYDSYSACTNTTACHDASKGCLNFPAPTKIVN